MKRIQFGLILFAPELCTETPEMPLGYCQIK